AFAREKIRQELVETRIAARQVVRKVVGDLLDEQVVFRRIGDEDWTVLEYEVECGRVRLVFYQFYSVNVEYFDREAKTRSELRVRAQMVGCAGEANQGAVVARLGIDALRIRRRRVGQYLDFCLDQAE